MSVQERRSPDTAAEPDGEISAYDRAKTDLRAVNPRWQQFAQAVIEHVTLESSTYTDGYLEIGPMLEPFDHGRVLDSDGDGLNANGHVFVYPDGTRQFIGQDETAKENHGLFGYVIHPSDPLPAIRTVEEGYELLKPAGMDRALHERDSVERQGEWWLLETDDEPRSSIFKPGVGSRPFGGSPLGNHIPREWAMGVPGDVFMDRVREKMPELLNLGESPDAIFDTIGKAQIPAQSPDVELVTELPELAAIRELAEGIYVRGTLRHRQNDHFLTSIGEEWKLAKTHQYDIDVYTPEQVGAAFAVHLD